MLQEEYTNSSVIKRTYKGHVFAVVNLDTFQRHAGLKSWTVINVEKKGHIERACRSNTSTGTSSKIENERDNVKYKQKRHVRTVQHKNERGDSSSEEVNTVRIMSVDGSSDGYWAEPQLEGHSVKMQIDTGSKASLLSHKLYKKYMRQVVRKLSHSLTPLQEILEKNSDVFRDELGSMKDIILKLHVKADSKPVFMKARPVPYAIRTKVEADVDALVKNGVLEPVTISEWATPIGHRPVLLAEQYPLPLIADLFSGLSGGKNSARYISVRLT